VASHSSRWCISRYTEDISSINVREWTSGCEWNGRRRQTVYIRPGTPSPIISYLLFKCRFPILPVVLHPTDSSIERNEASQEITHIDTATSRASRSSASSGRGVDNPPSVDIHIVFSLRYLHFGSKGFQPGVILFL